MDVGDEFEAVYYQRWEIIEKATRPQQSIKKEKEKEPVLCECCKKKTKQ